MSEYRNECYARFKKLDARYPEIIADMEKIVTAAGERGFPTERVMKIIDGMKENARASAVTVTIMQAALEQS